MKKINYIFWKVIIHLLLMVIATAFGVPLCAVLSMNGIDGHIISIAVSVGTLAIFILLQYWLILRSDLSNISMRDYLLGETAAFALVTAVGNGILAVISKGNVPVSTSYASIPVFAMTHLLKSIIPGSAMTVAIYFFVAYLLYLLKKKKDPALMGRKQTSVSDINEVKNDD